MEEGSGTVELYYCGGGAQRERERKQGGVVVTMGTY